MSMDMSHSAGGEDRVRPFVISTFQASTSALAANHGCCYLLTMIVKNRVR